jgi:hypothetical protein
MSKGKAIASGRKHESVDVADGKLEYLWLVLRGRKPLASSAGDWDQGARQDVDLMELFSAATLLTRVRPVAAR